MKQTGVDWLIEKLIEHKLVDVKMHPDNILFHAARQKQEKQIEIAYNEGARAAIENYIDQECGIESHTLSAPEYYKETFKQD